jgi:GTPase SAR1 family protein
MRQDRLAIILVGNQNSGKTTTLKYYCNSYRHHQVGVFKQGWRHNITPFADKFYGVRISAYFLPSSRSEKATPLKETFDSLDWWPDFLFMAEQLNGAEYNNTIRILRENDYHIKEFILDNKNMDSIWHYYDPVDENLFLQYRKEAIAEYVRQF